MADIHIRNVDADDRARAVARARLAGSDLSAVMRGWLHDYAAGLEVQSDRVSQSLDIRVVIPPADEQGDADLRRVVQRPDPE